jgi:hypothetical protein
MSRYLWLLLLLLPTSAYAQSSPPPSATYCSNGGVWVPCPANSTGTGGITGPTSTVPNDLAAWGNATGTSLSDSGVQTNNLTLLSANNTFVGNNIAPNFTLNNVAGLWKPLDFNTSGTQRWQIGSDSDAETGNNSGSDFDIFSYADNGTTLTNVLHIQRSTGSAAFADNVISPEFDVDGSSGAFRLIRYETSGALDFSVGLDQVGNYTIFRHNPSNNQVIDTPVVINLSNGSVSLSQRPGWIVGSTTATPWDSVNLNPANFMPITPGTVAGVPVAILGDAISNGASGNSTAFAANFVSGDLHSQLDIYPSSTAQNAPSGGTGTNSVVQAGDAAILVSQPNSGLPALTIGVAAPDAPSPAGIRLAETSGGGASIALGVRPTFAGNLAWDVGNLPSPLSTTTAASTYCALAGCTMTGILTASEGAVFNNGQTSNGTVTSASFSDGGSTPNAINVYPALTLGAFNGITQTGDSAIIAGTSAGTGDLVVAPWLASGADGLRLTPTGNTVAGPTAFNADSTWGTDASVTTPTLNIAGTAPANKSGIEFGGDTVLSSDGANTFLSATSSGGALNLTSSNTNLGADVDTNGVLHANDGLSVTGATTLATATVTAPATGDNTTSVPSTAWVDTAISNAIGGGGGNPTFTSATITGALTVGGKTTLPGIVITGTAINATAVISAPSLQATGANGIFDAGQLQASGPVTLGNASTSVTTIFGAVTIGGPTDTGTLNVLNGITTPSITGSGSTPTISIGLGAGTNASSSVAGTALSGSFSVTAGANPANGGVVATITAANTSFPSVPFCVVSSGSPSTAILYTTPSLSSGTLTVAFTLANNEQLASGTSYVYNWFCP